MRQLTASVLLDILGWDRSMMHNTQATRLVRFLTGVALALLADAAPANILGIHTMVQDNDRETFTQLDQAAELCGYGGWVKEFMYVNPPDHFDTRMLDFVNYARMKHLNVVGRLHYLPSGYGVDPNNGASKPKNDPDGSFTTYKDLIRDYVKGFQGHLHYAEIWNEPNLSYEWSGQANPEEFLRAMMAAYDGVKEADPTCRVLFPGLAPTDDNTGGNMNNLQFLERCLTSTYRCPRDNKLLKAHFDILGNHSYALNHPATYTADKYSVIGYTFELNICARYGKYPPVLITECGYQLNDQRDGNYPPVTEQFRADNMVIAFRDVWAKDPRVLGAMPYYLHSVDPWRQSEAERDFWWVYDDGSHTRQFDAVRGIKPLLEDTPGNTVNAYGNKPHNSGVDPVNLVDVLSALRVATGTVPKVNVEPSLLLAADVYPPDVPDDAITVADAMRILRFATGLEAEAL